jgi:hypothetical protein
LSVTETLALGLLVLFPLESLLFTIHFNGATLVLAESIDALNDPTGDCCSR